MDKLPDQFQKRKDLFLNKEGKNQRHLEDIYHQRTSGTYLSDLVFGANDGVVTTFAVVAGSAGANLSPFIVLVMGFANLLADGFSMGIGNFLGKKSELEYQKGQFNKEMMEIKYLKEIEEYETRKILERQGYKDKTLEEVYKNITGSDEKWAHWMLKEELGITESSNNEAAKHGIATTLAFIVAGLIPLIPFILGFSKETRFTSSIIATAITLFTSGALRSKVFPKPWWKAGLEMLFVGSVAAIVAYGVGILLDNFVPKA